MRNCASRPSRWSPTTPRGSPAATRAMRRRSNTPASPRKSSSGSCAPSSAPRGEARLILPQEIIRRKRDGAALSGGEIDAFIAGLTSGGVTEGQAAAFAMAVFFRGMTLPERVALTEAMTRSGTTIDWARPDLPGPVLDKHSTGGVGDNVSLMLAPMLAALRRLRADDLRPRPRPHRRHARQARSIPGYDTKPDPSDSGRWSRCRLRDHRPDGDARARRPSPLRDPRRDRDRRVANTQKTHHCPNHRQNHGFQYIILT